MSNTNNATNNTNTNTNIEFLSLAELNEKLAVYDAACKEYARLKVRLDAERARFNGNNNVPAALEAEVEKAGEELHKIYNAPLSEARTSLVLTKGEFVKARFIQFRHDWTDLELMKKDGEVLLAVNGADIDGEDYVSVYYPDRTQTYYEKTLEEKTKEAESTKAKLRW